MSLVCEGTSMQGFLCDEKHCGRRALWSPVIRVPHEGYPVEIAKPLFCMTAVQVCTDHWNAVEIDKLMHKVMKRGIEELFAIRGSRPAFARAYLTFMPVHSGDYQQFLETTGIVKPGDATPEVEGMKSYVPRLDS